MNISPLKRLIGRHLSDVHAQNAVCLPVFSVLEVTKNHMSSAQSLDARTAAYASGIFGVGFLYAQGNDLLRWTGSRFGFSSSKAEKTIDTLYGGLFFYGYSFALYALASKMDLPDADVAARTSAVIGVLIGSSLGYCTNLWRDGFNIENPKGLPTFLRGAPLKKRLITVALTASLALGTTVGAYKIKDNYQLAPNTLEQVLSLPD